MEIFAKNKNKLLVIFLLKKSFNFFKFSKQKIKNLPK